MENLLIILVVEDDPLIQPIVEDALTDGGFEIAIAPSGETAVELLDASDAKYKARVTDINLGRGKMDGAFGSRGAFGMLVHHRQDIPAAIEPQKPHWAIDPVSPF